MQICLCLELGKLVALLLRVVGADKWYLRFHDLKLLDAGQVFEVPLKTC